MLESIGVIFNELLTRPLFNALVWLYNVIPGHDLGVAIIILTAVIRLILYPLSKKGIRSQKALSQLQPEIKEIQKKYKNSKEEQAKQMMALYQKYKINPVSGCLPILIQFPILIALYRVFYSLTPGGLAVKMNGLYSFISRPEVLNPISFGRIDLSRGNPVLAILAGLLMFIQSKMMTSKIPSQGLGQKIGGMDFGSMLNKQMTYFMPIFIVFIAWKLPAALSLYWVVITLIGIIQQYLTKTEVGAKNV